MLTVFDSRRRRLALEVDRRPPPAGRALIRRVIVEAGGTRGFGDFRAIELLMMTPSVSHRDAVSWLCSVRADRGVLLRELTDEQRVQLAARIQ